MLSKYVRPFFRNIMGNLAARLHAMGVTPNTVTYTGFVLTALSAIILANGYFLAGGLLLWLAAMFDMVDGDLARLTDQSSTFGAFLDSTLDRYAESVTFFSIAYFYVTQPNTQTELVLIFVILIGSLMVSYTRARAEALSVECKAGILQRPERLVLIITGLITGWMLPALWILAILTNFTAFQRIYEVYWRTHKPSIHTLQQRD